VRKRTATKAGSFSRDAIVLATNAISRAFAASSIVSMLNFPGQAALVGSVRSWFGPASVPYNLLPVVGAEHQPVSRDGRR